MSDEPVPYRRAPGEGVPFALSTGSGHGLAGTGDTGGAVTMTELVIRAGEGPALHVHSRDHEGRRGRSRAQPHRCGSAQRQQ
ncbi:hypothetical protein [Pseudonocardia sp.]|uniref:hypothetical protein n=1 Tax=Pseudonocardia sp. TaxID=60912 RepID=UPI003D10B90C